MKYDIQKLFPCHSVITGLSGKLGNYVFYMRYGRICARKYIVPSNPRSARQQEGRSKFADAVGLWRGLDETERAAWNERARKKGRTGYNFFISEHMRRVTMMECTRSRPMEPELRIIVDVSTPEPRRCPVTSLSILRQRHVSHRAYPRRTRAPAEIRAA